MNFAIWVWYGLDQFVLSGYVHDDVIKWKHFPHYWPFVRGTTGHRWIPLQMSVTRSFDVSYDLPLNKWLSKQSRRRWFETPSLPLWRHCNVMHICKQVVVVSRWTLVVLVYENWFVPREDIIKSIIDVWLIWLQRTNLLFVNKKVFSLNTLKPEWKFRHFMDGVLKCFSLKEMFL